MMQLVSRGAGGPTRYYYLTLALTVHALVALIHLSPYVKQDCVVDKNLGLEPESLVFNPQVTFYVKTPCAWNSTRPNTYQAPENQ